MNLNPQTIEVLNNYQTINSNIALGEPGFVRTMSVSKTLMAKTNIPDQFPYEFGIYDLGEFLACINMFDNPTLAFDDNKKHLKGQGSISKDDMIEIALWERNGSYSIKISTKED